MTGGTVAFEKAPQNFYEGVGMNFVCASRFAHQFGSVLGIRRSFASGCGSIRLLRGEIAGYSFSLYSEEKRRVTIWMQMKRYDWRSWMARYGLR